MKKTMESTIDGAELAFELEDQYMLFYGIKTEEEIRLENLRRRHV